MRMLIAIRGTRHSQATLQLSAYALEACRDCKAPTVMTVMAGGSDRRRADAILAKAADQLALSGGEVHTLVVQGSPVREITREASSGGYHLVVVGERPPDRHPARLSRRSTTWHIVEQAPCSVLIAKGRISPIRRILLCDSGAHDSPALGDFTARLANAMGSDEEVTVLHVMSQMGAGPGVEGRQLRADVNELIAERTPEGELLERDLAVLDQSGVRPRPLVRRGLVVDEILAEARNGLYDLVIIGAHRGQGWQRFLLDDLAFKIAAGLDRPVLIARVRVPELVDKTPAG
jgi:nucleotide-binding universal stress UspA family protein